MNGRRSILWCATTHGLLVVKVVEGDGMGFVVGIEYRSRRVLSVERGAVCDDIV